MAKSIVWGLLLLCIALSQVGCPRTVVRKNPDSQDNGLRFYRSKPYLLISPKDGDMNKVVISMQYMPDFSEEYSIRAYTGLIGTNKTEVKLNESGVLTELNVSVDSKASEFVKSVADLIRSVPQPTARDVASPPSVRSDGLEVTAYRVPLGYYEAVVSRGPDCAKHLYGWRYVGFAPFNQCPLQGAGLERMDCQSSSLFGLVNDNGAMVFKRIDELAYDTVTVGTANSLTTNDLRRVQLEKKINEFLETKKALPAGGVKVEIDDAHKIVSFTADEPISTIAAEELGKKMVQIVNDLLQGYTAVNNT